MSGRPGSDQILGDKTSCDLIVPHVRDPGEFEVRRALPSQRRQMIGPFIFFDQAGPAALITGKGIDIRPHPYIGLATVTYLWRDKTSRQPWHRAGHTFRRCELDDGGQRDCSF